MGHGADLARGHHALARGEWDLARAAFEQALHHAETPEALEGLGTAAWWLDDGVAVFAARERAYRLYRRRGNRRGAGRVATALAGDYFHFHGEAAVARGWHQRADRLLNGLPLGSEHGWLRLWQGDLSLKLGDDPARARPRAARAATIGRALGDINLEFTALALEGLTFVIEGELSEGMPRLDEATTAAVSGEMTDPLAIGLTCCYLVTACDRIRDFARAAQWCQRVKEFCARTRFAALDAVCQAEHATVLMWHGAWAEAEEKFETAIRQLRATRPAMQADSLIRLAQLRCQQGRLDEAGALLQESDGHPHATLGRAALALDRSEPTVAAHLARRFLRQTPALNRTDRVAALEVLVRALTVLGRRTDARAAVEQLEAIAVMIATEPVRATARAAAGLVAAAEGDHDGAVHALEDAIALFGRSGVPFEVARSRVELARVLAERGERDVADAELGEAILAFQRLGAPRHAAAAAALRGDLKMDGRTPPAGIGPAIRLTRRELEVLRLIAHGLSNQKIASRLVVSEFTIKRHVSNLLGKLDLPSRAAAAAHAAREGLA
jgi:LuxR family maltose regulon positive regulatory protein